MASSSSVKRFLEPSGSSQLNAFPGEADANPRTATARRGAAAAFRAHVLRTGRNIMDVLVCVNAVGEKLGGCGDVVDGETWHLGRLSYGGRHRLLRCFHHEVIRWNPPPPARRGPLGAKVLQFRFLHDPPRLEDFKIIRRSPSLLASDACRNAFVGSFTNYGSYSNQ